MAYKKGNIKKYLADKFTGMTFAIIVSIKSNWTRKLQCETDVPTILLITMKQNKKWDSGQEGWKKKRRKKKDRKKIWKSSARNRWCDTNLISHWGSVPSRSFVVTIRKLNCHRCWKILSSYKFIVSFPFASAAAISRKKMIRFNLIICWELCARAHWRIIRQWHYSATVMAWHA